MEYDSATQKLFSILPICYHDVQFMMCQSVLFRFFQLSLAEDSIHLKLEIQSIKESFLHLLRSLERFESNESRMTHQRPSISARARVRALYEARKARILARRQQLLNKENDGADRSPVPPPVPKRSPRSRVQRSPGALDDIAGDYVTLKSPSPSDDSKMAAKTTNETSVWVDSPQSVESPPNRKDPLKYASSTAISELYTSKRWQDISRISLLSQPSFREQPSSSASHQNFHSTFSYPLHSTLLPPQQETPPPQEDPASPDTSPIFSTPPRHPQPELCKEHGIHPIFGPGPCIFQTDESTTVLSSSSDFTDVDQSASPPQPETDCDSSYLSECVDDKMSQSETEEYTATYDQRKGRMRMLRRQTGHTHLKTPQYPVGLSETDLLHDVTLKHRTIDATRASLPDLSGLESNRSESTLLAPLRGRDSSQENLTSSTLVLGDLDVALRIHSSSDSSPQPASGTTDESPESGSGLAVPVNSPNVTDSGGSSSRPTTDSYDYVDIPGVPKPPQYNLPPPRSSRPPCTVGKLPTPHDVRSHSSRRSGSSGRRSQSSSRSGGAKSLDHALLHCYRTRKTPEPDSGFSTQGSWKHQHFNLVDGNGSKRTVVQHPSVALQADRKKVLAKKLRKFSNNFYRVNSTGNLHIQTLGHF